MNGSKDSPIGTLWLGIILPGLLVAIVLVNIVTGCVCVPVQGRHALHLDITLGFYHDAWRVVGVILFELGVAGGLFTWYFLADRDDTEKWVFPGLWIAVTVMCAGLALFVIGFF